MTPEEQQEQTKLAINVFADLARVLDPLAPAVRQRVVRTLIAFYPESAPNNYMGALAPYLTTLTNQAPPQTSPLSPSDRRILDSLTPYGVKVE